MGAVAGRDEARLVLGPRRGDDWSNASTALSTLLKTLALKGNQPQLHEAVVETYAVEQDEGFEGCEHDFHKTVNKNHGRIETRRCWVIRVPAYSRYVDPDGAWPDLRSLVLIEAQRRHGDQVTSETRYYMSAGGCAGSAAGRA